MSYIQDGVVYSDDGTPMIKANPGTPGSATEKINKDNPLADPNKPYVQEGDTGGYLVGKGVTIGAGSSITPAERDKYLADAKAAGVSDGWISHFLGENPNDYNRILGAWQQEQGGGSSGGGGGGGGGSNVTQSWQQTPAPAPPQTDPYLKDFIDSQKARQAENDAKASALYNTLLERSKQSLAIDPNDPTIKGQVDAFSAQERRGTRNALSDIAEAQGPYANLTGQERILNEHAGQSTGAFQANLIGQELTARRNEIAQSLASMGGMLSLDQQQELQRQLATLDQAIKQQQLGLQDKALGLDWQKALLSNQQFMDQLGLNAEDRSAYWDAVRSGLLT